MNYAHNNLRLKKLQFRLEKLFKQTSAFWNTVKPSRKTVELVIEE